MSKLFMILCLALFLLSCGNQVADTGSGSGLGNPVIVGIARYPDGKPAIHASVSVRPVSYVSGEKLSEMLGEGFDEKGMLHTDSSGKYRGELRKSGQWIIEIVLPNEDNAASEVVTLGTDIHFVNPLVLAPQDTIKGQVRFYGARSLGAVVNRMGSDQKVSLDKDGYFTIVVPVGVHSLKIIADSSTYLPRVIENVQSGSKIPLIHILAEHPISSGWIGDSLIVRAILDSNNFREVPVSAVTERSNGRISKLEIDDTLKFYSTTKVFDTIPDLMLGLTSMTELEISRTNLRSLPKEIGSMTWLKEIELPYNRLTTVPASIVKITLESNGLSLTGNQIKSLPSEVDVWVTKYDPDWKEKQLF